MALYSFWIDRSGINNDLLRLFSFSEIMLDGYSCIWSLLALLECTNWILSWETGVCLHAFMLNDMDLCGLKNILMQQTDIPIHYIPHNSLFQKWLVLIVPKYLLQHHCCLLVWNWGHTFMFMCTLIGLHILVSHVKIERYKAAPNVDIYLHNYPEHCIFDITAPCFVEYDNRAIIPWWWCARWSLAPLWYRFLDDSYVHKKFYRRYFKSFPDYS